MLNLRCVVLLRVFDGTATSYERFLAKKKLDFGFSDFRGERGETATVTTTATTAEEFPSRLEPPSHHAQGFNVQFGHAPSLRKKSLNAYVKSIVF